MSSSYVVCTFVTIPQGLAGTKALVDKSVFTTNGKRATVPLPQATIEALGARVVEREQSPWPSWISGQPPLAG